MALLFASGQFVDHGSDATDLDPILAGPATFLARIYRTADGANCHIMTKDNSFPSGWGFLVDNGPGEGALRLIIQRATTDTDYISVAGTIPLNSWRYVMATWDDAATPEVHLYTATVGGAFTEVTYDTQIDGAGSPIESDAALLYVGNLQRATTTNFKGRIDGVGIYNRVLSEAEGEAHRDDFETPLSGAVLLTHYVTTASMTDHSGAGNDGTLTGATTADGWPEGPAPTVTACSPSSDTQGLLNLPVTITGTDFQDGATVAFSGTGITVLSTTFVSATRIDVEIDVDRNAAQTARDVTVTNPDTRQDSLIGGFTVTASPWSAPFEVVADDGRMASIDDEVHVIGTSGGNLIHRKSTDQGATWGAATTIAAASGNIPCLYAGLTVGSGYIIAVTTSTNPNAAGNVSARRSTDGGATWSSPVQIAPSSDDVRRIETAVSGNTIHIAGGNSGLTIPFQGYIRSTDGGVTWDTLVRLDETDGTYDSVGPGAIAANGDTVHLVYAKRVIGADGRLIWYIRSLDGGDTWSSPVLIGGSPVVGYEQRRERIVVDGQRVAVAWEGHISPLVTPTLTEIAVARSLDGGSTWQQPVFVSSAGLIATHHDFHHRAKGLTHFTWRQGDTIALEASDVVAWMRSLNYGASWGRMEIACDMEGVENHVYNARTTSGYVHSLSGSTAAGFQYVRRAVGDVGASPLVSAGLVNRGLVQGGLVQ